MEEMEAEVKEGWRRSKGVAEKRACVKNSKEGQEKVDDDNIYTRPTSFLAHLSTDS